MDEDRKSPGLKALQGLIWQEGFTSGELRGEVYPDVPPALERWRQRGRDIYIYSSGSVLAQQLLFGSTSAGDLTRLVKGYFDTAVGAKQEPDSYRIISTRIDVPAAGVLFVSDVVAELDAARAAGMRTALCVRDAARAVSSLVHPIVRTFDGIAD
jgi:enolase-phosphatase E1